MPQATTADGRHHDLRELTGWDEEFLERRIQERNTARVCNELIARCLETPGADLTTARATVGGWLVAERDRALLRLRRQALGDRATAQTTCGACRHEMTVQIALDQLDREFATPAREHEVDVADLGPVRLRLPTAGDQADLLDASLETDAEQLGWILARCLQQVGETPGPFDLAFAQGLPTSARRTLEEVLTTRLPSVELTTSVDCVACGASIDAPLDLTNFFFRADLPSARPPAQRARARARLSLGGGRHPLDAHTEARCVRTPARRRGDRRRVRTADQRRAVTRVGVR